MKILVIDDEQEFVKVLAAAFEVYRPGYTVVAAHTGTEGLARAEVEEPDLVLLDVTLPDMDGLEVCRRLRASRQVPILLLASRHGDEGVTQGLEAEADDYIIKPFRYPALMARVDELLFRARAMPSAERPSVLQWGDLVIDFAQGQVRLRGKDIELTAQEYRILEELALNAGHVISHEALLARIWAGEYRHDPQYLRTYVYRLRRKIEVDPQHPRHIVTHHGQGYRLARGDSDGEDDARTEAPPASGQWQRATR